MPVFSKDDFFSSKSNLVNRVNLIQQKLTDLSCPEIFMFEFSLSSIGSEEFDTRLSAVPGSYKKEEDKFDYLYIIQIHDEARHWLPTLREALMKERDNHSDFCTVNEITENNNTLYVGRSKNLKSRLKQHFGSEYRGTYAMHLGRWATQYDVSVLTTYLVFENQDDSIIQMIEDELWEILKPAFGRKGTGKIIKPFTIY